MSVKEKDGGSPRALVFFPWLVFSLGCSPLLPWKTAPEFCVVVAKVAHPSLRAQAETRVGQNEQRAVCLA